MQGTFTELFAQLTALMTQNASFFQAFGARLFVAFAIIIIVWFGVQASLSGGFRMDRFVSMVMMLTFGFAMSRYYSTPIPGIGISLYHIIVDEGTALATQLNDAMASKVFTGLDAAMAALQPPGFSAILNWVEVFRWVVIFLALCVAEIAVFVIIAYGYIAVAICTLLGPIFVPFFIVPKMEWLFWGWLRATIQYAFYPVIANAYLFVFGSLLINFLNANLINIENPSSLFILAPLLIMLVAFVYGMLKIPSLVNSIFTGRAGESAVPNLSGFLS